MTSKTSFGNFASIHPQDVRPFPAVSNIGSVPTIPPRAMTITGIGHTSTIDTDQD